MKTLIRKIAAIIFRALPLDGLLRLLLQLSAELAQLIFIRDWRLLAYGMPQYFKHQINLSRWVLEPARWSFAARGVYARETMFKGCNVLDLCCGDGSYSYLFFSDIAAKVDAVDNDPQALAYAKRYHSASPVTYHKINILEEALPSEQYDVIVWNAAICYFSDSQIRTILEKIVRAGKHSMVLCGMAPQANKHVDHKTEFQSRGELEALLYSYFDTVTIREVAELTNTSYYFIASGPLPLH